MIARPLGAATIAPTFLLAAMVKSIVMKAALFLMRRLLLLSIDPAVIAVGKIFVNPAIDPGRVNAAAISDAPFHADVALRKLK